MEYHTMSITSYGPCTLPKEGNKLLTRFQEKKINDVSDIDGARSQPKYKHYFSDKPAFMPSDVEGSTSKPLTHSRNTMDNSLYIDDIEGTRFVIKDRMMKTKRHINPLEPEYELPSYVPAENTVPKFIKDPMNNKDIEGAQVRPKKWYATRDILSVSDIAGAQSSWRPRHAKARLEAPPHDLMAVADIAAKTHRYIDKTSRCTNTLNPEYFVNGMTFKDAAYTRPRPNRDLIPDSAVLRTDDIPGAYPGWKAEKAPRRDFRNTNFLDDIPGARADTIRPGIVTQRQVNPLQPVYQSLDPGELIEPPLRPLVPADMVKMPTIPPRRTSSGPHNPYGLASSAPASSRQAPSPGPFLGTFGQSTFGGPATFGAFSPAPGGSLRTSPAASTRDSGREASSAQRRATQAKLDEINLVRQLRS